MTQERRQWFISFFFINLRLVLRDWNTLQPERQNITIFSLFIQSDMLNQPPFMEQVKHQRSMLQLHQITKYTIRVSLHGLHQRSTERIRAEQRIFVPADIRLELLCSVEIYLTWRGRKQGTHLTGGGGEQGATIRRESSFSFYRAHIGVTLQRSTRLIQHISRTAHDDHRRTLNGRSSDCWRAVFLRAGHPEWGRRYILYG